MAATYLELGIVVCPLDEVHYPCEPALLLYRLVSLASS